MKIFTKTTITILVLTITGIVNATTIGSVTRTTADPSGKGHSYNQTIKHVEIGESNAYTKGKAGINIAQKDLKKPNNQYQSFQEIAVLTRFIYIPRSAIIKDKNDIYVTRMYSFPKISSYIPDYSDSGRMSFKQVGNQDVWFGDWEDVPRNSKNAAAQSSKYTVYYAGSNPTTAAQLPKSGQTTYTVVGINKHRDPNTAVLKGEMKADFGAKTLNGTISRTGLAVAVNSRISADASFNGTARANNSVNGVTKGHFYGNQAAALAGIADFGTHNQYNTAFGGMKK
ncbi:Slam-dependent surface lipoprotein [Aggregatibacter kilianii]|uniref:Slam-dependent surface lipoprotein n=1 Tax=Aggregatibacter kilianii TaxID=2025884 RepID=UPI000D69EBB5|nr:Slam-dependent surface lipoprotein [Aggregatibacter kilianii]